MNLNKQFESFVIKGDEFDNFSFSCDPDGLANYFGKNTINPSRIMGIDNFGNLLQGLNNLVIHGTFFEINPQKCTHIEAQFSIIYIHIRLLHNS